MTVARHKTYLVDTLLLTAVVVWGFNFALMKQMYRYFHPIAFNAVRFTISSIAMLAILRLLGETIGVDRKDWRGIFWLGFLGNTVYPFIFVLGLDRTKAGARRGAADGADSCFCIPHRRRNEKGAL